MSETEVIPSQAPMLDAALAAGFKGGIPPFLQQLIDRELHSRMSSQSRASLVIPVSADAPARVRLTSMEDGGRVAGLIVGRWPGAQRWLDRWPGAYVQFDLDGLSDRLCIYFVGVPVPERPGVPDGVQPHGARVWLPEGRMEAYSVHDQLPTAHLSPALAAAIGQAPRPSGGMSGGMWFCSWSDGLATSATWVSENADPVESARAVAAFGAGPRFDGARVAYESSGKRVHPYAVEWTAEGAVEITLWGLEHRKGADLKAPALFASGQVPTADQLADTIAAAQSPEHQAEARELVRSFLYPALAAGSAEHFARSVDELYLRLADDEPAGRIPTVRAAAWSAWLAMQQTPAFQLGLARYVLAHPEAHAPEEQLPAEIRGLPVEQLITRASELLQQVNDIAALRAGVPHLLLRQIPDMTPNTEAIVDMLQRAVSGDFTGASGSMHEYLLEIGAGGYDDDPALASLEDLDLDAAASRAAIEEALADDD